jgi:hypothetical protein
MRTVNVAAAVLAVQIALAHLWSRVRLQVFYRLISPILDLFDNLLF